MSLNQVEIVRLEEKKVTGIPVTCSFQFHDPAAIEEAKQLFLSRRHEIKQVINPHQYVCPHYSSEVSFTYFYCYEVSELAEIPAGMIGFTIPPHTYGTTRSDSDPYEVIHTYLANNGMKNNSKALAMEIYQIEDPQWPSKVDVFVPVME
jgi:Uncharacterized protein conserved in bacteria